MSRRACICLSKLLGFCPQEELIIASEVDKVSEIPSDIKRMYDRTQNLAAVNAHSLMLNEFPFLRVHALGSNPVWGIPCGVNTDVMRSKRENDSRQ